MALSNAELPEGPEIRVVAPDGCRRCDHGILTCFDPRIVRIPPPGMRYDFVTDSDACDFVTDGVHHSGRIAPSDVEVVRVAALLTSRDDIYRDAAGCPHIVEVDTGCHYAD